MSTDPYCFCDLVPLYALNLLSEAECSWIEQQIIDCPDLAEELVEYEVSVTAIPYSVPVVSMPADLKDRLFAQLDLNPPEPVLQAPTFSAVRSQDLNWQPHPTPGVMIAIVHADEVTRELVGFLRAEPGIRYPLHRHTAIEEIFMLEGDLRIGNEIYGAGDYIRSHPGSAHAPYTIGGCRFFFHTSMDDDYSELVHASAH